MLNCLKYGKSELIMGSWLVNCQNCPVINDVFVSNVCTSGEVLPQLNKVATQQLTDGIIIKKSSFTLLLLLEYNKLH